MFVFIIFVASDWVAVILISSWIEYIKLIKQCQSRNNSCCLTNFIEFSSSFISIMEGNTADEGMNGGNQGNDNTQQQTYETPLTDCDRLCIDRALNKSRI